MDFEAAMWKAVPWVFLSQTWKAVLSTGVSVHGGKNKTWD